MTPCCWTLFPILGVLALQPAPSVTSAPAPADHWEGTIQTPGQALAIEVDLARPADVWQGQITIPAQHIKGLPLTGVAADAGAVTFGMKSIPGDPRFKGTVGKDSKTMTGEFSQGGITMPFTLTWKGEARLETRPKNAPISKELEGTWEGTLNAGSATLRLVLKLSNANGSATGTLISLDQGAAEIPVTAITQTASHVTVGVSAIGGTFDGEMKDRQLIGTWAQGDATMPLVLTRSHK